MAYELEHRPDDRELKRLFDKLADAELDVEIPGKWTLAESALFRQSMPKLQYIRSASRPGQHALVGAELTSGPKREFRDCQALALRDVLSRLEAHPALREQTLAAADSHIADRLARRGMRPDAPKESSAPSVEGRGMWRVAERRAVTLYRRALAAGMVATETPAVTAALNSIGSGSPLAHDVVCKMERILRVRLDRVRIHTGRVAEDAAKAANAEAFTVGEDIFIPSYDPTSLACQKLLLHELVHCCQWWQGRIGPSAHRVSVSQPGDVLEHEAEAVVARAFHCASDSEPAEPRYTSLSPWGRKPQATPATLLIGPVPSAGGSFVGNSAMMMRQAKTERQEEEAPLSVPNFTDRWESIKQAPLHILEVGGEYALALKEHWAWICGGAVVFFGLPIAAKYAGPYAKAALISSSVVLAGLSAWGAHGAYTATNVHLEKWKNLADKALGDPGQIALASREWVRTVGSWLAFLSSAGIAVAKFVSALKAAFAPALQATPSTSLAPTKQQPTDTVPDLKRPPPDKPGPGPIVQLPAAGSVSSSLEPSTEKHSADNTLSAPGSLGRRRLDQPTPNTDAIKARIKKARRRKWLLDYDGTLKPFHKDPQAVAPGPKLLKLLRGLQSNPKNEVTIISGRSDENLEAWLGQLPIRLIGNHGISVREPKVGGKWTHEPLSLDWIPQVHKIMSKEAYHLPGVPDPVTGLPTEGSFIEDTKKYSVGWHYRAVADEQAGIAAAEKLVLELEPICAANGLQALRGNKVIEVKVNSVNKGTAAARVVGADAEGVAGDQVNDEEVVEILVGDDETDEYMFGKGRKTSVTVKVGEAPSVAKYRLESVDDVLAFLEDFIE